MDKEGFQMTVKQSINELLDVLPAEKLIVIYNFVRDISDNKDLKFDEMNCSVLSQNALAKDWLTEEEDEFWKNL